MIALDLNTLSVMDGLQLLAIAINPMIDKNLFHVGINNNIVLGTYID
jgi:hypothetical protein